MPSGWVLGRVLGLSRVGRVTDVTTSADLTELSDLRETIRGLMPQLRLDLEALTRIQSVSLPAFDQAHVEEFRVRGGGGHWFARFS